MPSKQRTQPKAEHPIGVIVATHGDLARSLVDAAELILGRSTGLTPFPFAVDEDARASSNKLQGLIRKMDQGAGVVILVDLFGGTPGSLALSMLDERSVEVVTGVNLPMALAAAGLQPGTSLEEAGTALVAAGQESIKGAIQLLKA